MEGFLFLPELKLRTADAYLRELTHLQGASSFSLEFWCKVDGLFHYADRSCRT